MQTKVDPWMESLTSSKYEKQIGEKKVPLHINEILSYLHCCTDQCLIAM